MAAGLPGNIQKLADAGFNFVNNYIGLPEEAKVLLRGPFQFPGSEELRKEVTPKIAEKLGKEETFFEPKSETERFLGDLTQDITSFFLPGTGQMKLAHRIGIPLLSNLSKEGATYLGAEEDTANAVKYGTMLFTTIAGISNPRQHGNQLIEQARQTIPDIPVNPIPLAQRLSPLWQRINKGLTGVPSKSKVRQGITDLAEQAQSGRLTTHSLMEARNNINEWIEEAGGFGIPKSTKKALIHNLGELKIAIIDTTNENLSAINPQAAQMYKEGYEALAVTHRSNAIGNFIQKNFGKPIKSIGTKLLFPGMAAYFIPKYAAAGGALFLPYKAGQVLYRVGQSPTLAKYYGNVLKYSLEKNAPAMAKNFSLLDKKLEEDEKKSEKKTKSYPKKMTLEEYKARFKP